MILESTVSVSYDLDYLNWRARITRNFLLQRVFCPCPEFLGELIVAGVPGWGFGFGYGNLVEIKC